MTMVQVLVDFLAWLWENREKITLNAVITAITYFFVKRYSVKFVTKHTQKMIQKHIPWLSSESRLDHMEEQIVKLGGDKWNAPKFKHYKVNIPLELFQRFTSLRMSQSIARFIKLRTNLRRRRSMTKDFLSGKKEFIAFIIAVLINGLNDTLGLDLSQHTLDTATYVGGYVAIEGVLDIIRSL